MNAPLSIILNKSILYNKRIAILFFIGLSLFVLVTFFDKGFETSKGNLFLISTLYLSISICLYRLIKEKNYEFHKYSLNINEYRLSSKKDKEKSYNEAFNRLLSEGLNNINSNTSKKVDEFLSNVQNELNKNLRKPITFERFDEYFTSINKDKTTSKLFYFQYKKSLIKIIKDFIIKTDKLENATDETISKFIRTLTNQDNLKFNQKKGLHYKDKFVSKFLKKNNNQKTIIQENVTSDVNEQIKIENIPIFKFYRILSNSIEEITKTKLNGKEKEELKSIIGFYFKSKKNNDVLKFKKDIQNISFTNSKISKKFILILKHLTEIHHIENHESKLSRILTLGINEKSFPRKVKNRTESIRKCYRNNNLLKNEKVKVNHILQEFLNNKT